MVKRSLKESNKLDFYKNRDETHPFNTLYDRPSEDFYGPVDTRFRSCTDWLMIPICLCFVAFTIIYSVMASEESDRNRLYYGMDFRADICGQFQLKDRPYQYLLNPDIWGGISICVSKCPSDPDFTKKICLYNNDGLTELEDYCYETYETELFGEICKPKNMTDLRRKIDTIINTDLYLAKVIGGDFYINFDVIIGAFVLQIGLGVIFVIILLAKRIAHVTIWSFNVIFCVALSFIAGYVTLEQERAYSTNCPVDIKNEQTDEVLIQGVDPYDCIPGHLTFLDAIRQILLVFIPVYAIYMLLNFHKILKMIQVMDSMIKPLRQMTLMLAVPFTVSFLQLMLAFFYMLIYVGGVSAGKIVTFSAPSSFPAPIYRGVEFQLWQERGFYIVTFLYFWLIQTLYYFVRFFIAGSCSVWYYSRDKNYLNAPILRPLFYALYYHSGSFLLGAILLPITWGFSALLYFWKLGLQGLKRQSIVLQILLFLSTPFFAVYEYFTKYISNRNFNHMAVFADNFWISGNKTFYLRIRNFSRVDLSRDILGFVRLIGMLFISSIGAYLVYFSLYSRQIIEQQLIKTNETQVSYPIVPTIFVFLTGLYVSQNFSSIIDIVAEVMTFDLIADEEMFVGKQRFGDPEMLDFVNKYSKEKQKNEFIISNKGKVNPLNEGGVNEVIKPINLKDLMGDNDDDDDDGKHHRQDDEDDQDNLDPNANQGNNQGDRDEDDDEKNRKKRNGEGSDDSLDEFGNKKRKFGINPDDLLGEIDGANDNEEDFDDELMRHNANRGQFKKIEEDDVRKVDLNYETRGKEVKKNKFQF